MNIRGGGGCLGPFFTFDAKKRKRGGERRSGTWVAGRRKYTVRRDQIVPGVLGRGPTVSNLSIQPSNLADFLVNCQSSVAFSASLY
jgi:hypothetical protein